MEMEKQSKPLLGSHVSFNKKEQLLASTKEALLYGANTFMFYTGAPQNTIRSEINDFKTIEAMKLMKENGIDISKVIVHAPYIINLANRKNLDFGIDFLTEELSRCDQLGIKYVVLHPGSHVGAGVEEGIKSISDGLNEVLKNYHGNSKILLETMAGKGSEIGSNFLELKQILDNVTYSNRLGICLDTCHLNDAGYDLTDFDKVLEQFDEILGIDKIGCIHINDSKNEIGAHKDRHENFGFGTLGFDTLIKIVYHEKLENVPKILESPYINGDYPPYKHEIEMIRNKKFNKSLIENIIEFYQ